MFSSVLRAAWVTLLLLLVFAARQSLAEKECFLDQNSAVSNSSCGSSLSVACQDYSYIADDCDVIYISSGTYAVDDYHVCAAHIAPGGLGSVTFDSISSDINVTRHCNGSEVNIAAEGIVFDCTFLVTLTAFGEDFPTDLNVNIVECQFNYECKIEASTSISEAKDGSSVDIIFQRNSLFGGTIVWFENEKCSKVNVTFERNDILGEFSITKAVHGLFDLPECSFVEGPSTLNLLSNYFERSPTWPLAADISYHGSPCGTIPVIRVEDNEFSATSNTAGILSLVFSQDGVERNTFARNFTAPSTFSGNLVGCLDIYSTMGYGTISRNVFDCYAGTDDYYIQLGGYVVDTDVVNQEWKEKAKEFDVEVTTNVDENSLDGMSLKLMSSMELPVVYSITELSVYGIQNDEFALLIGCVNCPEKFPNAQYASMQMPSVVTIEDSEFENLNASCIRAVFVHLKVVNCRFQFIEGIVEGGVIRYITYPSIVLMNETDYKFGESLVVNDCSFYEIYNVGSGGCIFGSGFEYLEVSNCVFEEIGSEMTGGIGLFHISMESEIKLLNNSYRSVWASVKAGLYSSVALEHAADFTISEEFASYIEAPMYGLYSLAGINNLNVSNCIFESILSGEAVIGMLSFHRPNGTSAEEDAGIIDWSDWSNVGFNSFVWPSESSWFPEWSSGSWSSGSWSFGSWSFGSWSFGPDTTVEEQEPEEEEEEQLQQQEMTLLQHLDREREYGASSSTPKVVHQFNSSNNVWPMAATVNSLYISYRYQTDIVHIPFGKDKESTMRCPIGYLFTRQAAKFGIVVSERFVCIECLVGHSYMIVESNSSVIGSCSKCPPNSQCIGANRGVPIAPLPGHYLDKTNMTDVKSYECPDGYCCTQQSGDCLSDTGCPSNREDFLCSRCTGGTCANLKMACVDCEKCSSTSFIVSNIFVSFFFTCWILINPGSAGPFKVVSYFLQIFPLVTASASRVLDHFSFLKGGLSIVTSVVGLEFVTFGGGGASCPFTGMTPSSVISLGLVAPLLYFTWFSVISIVFLSLSLPFFPVVSTFNFVRTVLIKVLLVFLKVVNRDQAKKKMKFWERLSDDNGDDVEPSSAKDVEMEEIVNEDEDEDERRKKKKETNAESSRGDSEMDVVDDGDVLVSAHEMPDDNDDLSDSVSNKRKQESDEDILNQPVLNRAAQIALAVRLCFSVVVGLRPWKRMRWWHSHRFILALMTLMLLAFKTSAETILRLVSCRSYEGDRRLYEDAAVECFNGWQIAILVFAGAFVFPAPFFIWGFRILARLVYGNAIFVSFGPEVAAVMESFEKPYKATRKWWESVMIGRRLLLLAIGAFSPNQYVRSVLLAIGCACVLGSHVVIRPFEDRFVQFYETTSLTLLVIISILGIRESVESVGSVEVSDGAVSLLIWLTFVFVIFMAVLVICVYFAIACYKMGLATYSLVILVVEPIHNAGQKKVEARLSRDTMRQLGGGMGVISSLQ